MKRVVQNRLTSMLFFASLLIVSAHVSASAASEPMKFVPTDPSEITLNAFLGDYDFDLYNRTSGWVLNGFYTQEDGKWSKNWLSSKLQPGKSFRMQWSSASNNGDCVVPFKVTWDGYDTAELYKLDWCKGIKSVYLKDDTFTVDYK
ncbi:MAG TPA: hypothetical protein VK468_06760 [Pyrinomonadaceae bacterium]|nr:hypothetical protein [Pyrinomonadaceae bacterium]